MRSYFSEVSRFLIRHTFYSILVLQIIKNWITSDETRRIDELFRDKRTISGPRWIINDATRQWILPVVGLVMLSCPGFEIKLNDILVFNVPTPDICIEAMLELSLLCQFTANGINTKTRLIMLTTTITTHRKNMTKILTLFNASWNNTETMSITRISLLIQFTILTNIVNYI